MMKLSNVEFMLLQIIYQRGEISGYEVDKIVEEREYRKWAGIGMTSIYAGLKKLEKKQLVKSYIDTGKQGKGPLPKKFRLTGQGRNALKKEILKALSSTRETDRRFDLAFSAIPVLTSKEVIEALNKRKEFLSEAAENIKKRFESLGGENLPINVKTLFKHPLFLIRHELKFIDALIKDIKVEGIKHEK